MGFAKLDFSKFVTRPSKACPLETSFLCRSRTRSGSIPNGLRCVPKKVGLGSRCHRSSTNSVFVNRCYQDTEAPLVNTHGD